ncbi:MAG: tetratricopeptide repeat protein, partial [Pseudomonadota bacterium]
RDTAAGVARPSVAVLAFENMSDGDQQFFADGMTEDITTALARCRDLTVISRTSSFAYRGKTVDARQIGRELGARYLLEGSVRRSVDRVRITTQLIDARSGHHVWAEKYDRSVSDVFAVQDEITANVAGATGSEITAAEAQQASHRDGQSLALREMLMKAEWHMSKGDRQHLAQAKALCEQAVAATGDASKVHSMLSMAYCTELLYSWGDTPADQLIDRAIEAARRATELDPQNEHGFLALGLSHWAAGRHQTAIDACQVAIGLNPTHCLGNLVLGFVWGYFGQENYEKARRLIDYSMTLGPRDLHGYWAHTHLAAFDLVDGDYDGALAKAALSITRNPGLGRAQRIKAAALALRGDQQAAKEAWNQSMRVDPIETDRYFETLVRTFYHAQEADRVVKGMKLAAGAPSE